MLPGSHRFSLELFISFRFLRGHSQLSLLHPGTRLSLIFMSLMVFIMVVVLSVFNGFQEEVKKSLWNSGYHITITYAQPGRTIGNYREILATILENQDRLHNNIRSVFPSIFVNALLEFQGRFEGKGIRAIPVYPEEVQTGSLRDFPELIHYDVSYLKKMNEENIAIIGKEMARYYGWQLGDRIVVFLPKGGILARGVQIQRAEFVIGGFFRTGFYEFDLNLIFISLETAQRILQIPSQTTSIIVQLHDLGNIDSYKYLLRDVLKNPYEYSISTIKDERGNFLAALQLEKTLMMMILGLLILAGIAGIWITSHLLVQSKKKSIGMLRAMGLPVRSILLIFVSHSMMIGFFSCLIGGSLGIYMSKNLEEFIKFLEDILYEMCMVFSGNCSPVHLIPRNIYYFDHLPVNTDINFVVAISVFTMLLSGIAGYFPARIAAKVEPVEILRNE